MGVPAFEPWSRRRALTVWLALWLLLWQAVGGVGAWQRPMAPLQFAEGALVICTEHGMQSMPHDGGAPLPADRQSPSCPCCLPFTVWGGAVLAAAPAVPAPDWVGAPVESSRLVASAPPRLAVHPQQPRAPPVSV